MTTALRIKRRASNGAAGAPTGLKSAELAVNFADGLLYIGTGDDGSGNATGTAVFAIIGFAANKLLPAAGATGQVLTKSAAGDYAVGWATPSPGNTYTAASGGGLTLNSGAFAADTSVMATVVFVMSGLAGKASTNATWDASAITTGVFDVSRIPVLPSQVQVVSSGDLTSLTTGQQTTIGQGTIVTTTDGNRYVYSGSGSKTAAASYVTLADITPEWTVIANKPTFAAVSISGAYGDLSGRPTLATVATSGSYADLSSKPTLGTMAAQAASAVAITGGTIDGVTLDGGTF